MASTNGLLNEPNDGESSPMQNEKLKGIGEMNSFMQAAHKTLKGAKKILPNVALITLRKKRRAPSREKDDLLPFIGKP